MKIVEFYEWMNEKFLEWRNTSRGRDGSISQFARLFGASQQVMSKWLAKDGYKPRDSRHINALVARYGPEVYDVLGLERPPQTPFDQLPESVRSRLVEATLRVQEELIRRGPDLTQSEADQIARDIFAGMGVTFTDTATQKDLPPSDIKP
jgi:hypothetical protein